MVRVVRVVVVPRCIEVELAGSRGRRLRAKPGRWRGRRRWNRRGVCRRRPLIVSSERAVRVMLVMMPGCFHGSPLEQQEKQG